MADLELLGHCLREVQGDLLARRLTDPVKRLASVFGFHLASLDIRQNSAFHDKALTQLMTAAGLPEAPSFPAWPEEKRLAFLNAELQTPRPFAHKGRNTGPEAEAVLDCFQVITQHLDRHGRPGLGTLIVSMTRKLSDLLAVYVLGRETGLTRMSEDGLLCRLPVVPLFETLDDLERSPGILDAFLKHPVTQRSLRLNASRDSRQRTADGGSHTGDFVFHLNKLPTQYGKLFSTKFSNFCGRCYRITGIKAHTCSNCSFHTGLITLH